MYCMCHYAILPVLSPSLYSFCQCTFSLIRFFSKPVGPYRVRHTLLYEKYFVDSSAAVWKQAMFSRSGSASSQPAYSLAFLPVYQIRRQDHRPALHVTVFFQIDAFQQQLLEITTKDIGDLWAKLCEAGVPIQTYFTWLLLMVITEKCIPCCFYTTV